MANFYEILKMADVDISREYDRLYDLFYLDNDYEESLYDYCAANFNYFPFRQRSISLQDFDETFGFEWRGRDV